MNTKNLIRNIVITIASIFLLIIIGIVVSFTPRSKTVIIKQNVGGSLICKSVYTADHHSWDYMIDYEYLTPEKEIIKIGSGIYNGREWKQNEQLVEYEDWYILKTGNRRSSDKIFVGDALTNNWREFVFSPEEIIRYNYWISTGIKTSLLKYGCESYVKEISGGIVTVAFKFYTYERTDELTTKIILFKINKDTGDPEMISVKDL